MRAILFLILFAPAFSQAQTVTADTVVAPTDGTLTLQSSVGTSLVGGSININATGDGAMILSTENQSDVDLVPSGNVVLWPQTEGYQVVMYGDSTVVGSEHGLQLQPYGSKPTCDASRRGTIFYTAGDTGVADMTEMCRKDAEDNYAWSNL